MAIGLITLSPLDQPLKTPTTQTGQVALSSGAHVPVPLGIQRMPSGIEVQTDLEPPIWGFEFRFDTHLMQAWRLSRNRSPHACNLGQVIQSHNNSGYPAENIEVFNRETC